MSPETLRLQLEHLDSGIGDGLALYDYLPSGNGWKVRRMLAALGIQYRWFDLELLMGETRSPWFLARNPVGEIPTIELCDGRCLQESSAILSYLAEGTPWLPKGRWEQAQVQRWLCFEQSRIDGVISRARFRWLFPDAVPTAPQDFDRWWAEGRRTLALLEDHLRRQDWMVGDAPTIADIAVYAYTHVAEEGCFDLAPFTALRAWHARFAALPGHLSIDQSPPPGATLCRPPPRGQTG